MKGFIPHIVKGGSASLEYKPAAAITPKVGLALAWSSGKLAVCGATTKPDYICMTEAASAVAAGTLIPVIPADCHIIFAVPAQAAMTSINLGDKVTLHTDGLQVTATKTAGVAQIIDRDGTAVGDLQYVRFSEIQPAASAGS